MTKLLLSSLLILGSAAAMAQDFGVPSNMGSDLDNMSKAAANAVVASPAVRAYAAEKGLGAIVDSREIYGDDDSGLFQVLTGKNCTFKARVSLGAFGWQASPVAGSQACR
jgi:hypothetical protein